MINTVDHNITIDLGLSTSAAPDILIKKGDTDSHKFIFTIIESGTAYNLTGLTARIYFVKSDGTVVFQDCTLDTPASGLLSTILTTQCLICAGYVSAELTVYGTAGELLTSASFLFRVLDIDRDDTALESTDEYSALNTALLTVTTHESRIDALETEVQTARGGQTNLDTRLDTVDTTLTGIKAVNGVVKGSGSGTFAAANATDLPITDTGNYFTTDNAGAALQEIGAQLADNVTQLDTLNTNKLDKTGSIGISQVDKTKGLIDQTYLSPVLIQQMAGTTPVNAIPADKSLLPKQFAFPIVKGVITKNIFDKSSTTIDTLASAEDGTVSTVAGYRASDFIPVLPNTVYALSKPGFSVAYDVNKAWIAGLMGGTWTSPSNCYYVKVNTADADIDTQQLELGNINTSYVPFKNMIDVSTMPVIPSNLIGLSTIDKTKLTFNPLTMIPSKNLYNSATSIIGHYVQSNGILDILASYNASDFIPVLPNTTYTKTNNERFAFYDIDKVYVSGVAENIAFTFTTPPTAYYVRINSVPSSMAFEQLELGSIATSYETFGSKIPSDSYGTGTINKEALSFDIGLSFKDVITVAKTGGDYSVIMDAVANALDSITNPVTIKVMPGIYNETVSIEGRYISIVGANKRTCILRNDEDEYFHPPINISSNNNISNMTIISTNDAEANYIGLHPYCIHHDSSATSGISEIFNCTLIGKNTASAVGIGLATDQTLIINSCDMTSSVNGFYAHNQQENGAINQRLIVKNCRIESENEKAIFIQDANHRTTGGFGDAQDTVFSFYNNIFWSLTVGKTDIVGGDAPLDINSKWGYIKLSADSFGNNIAELNA